MNRSYRPLEFGLTYHVEGPRDRPSAEIYAEIAEQVRFADRLGFSYAWLSEHHAHAHYGHMPAPLLFALHLTGQTERIRLGTAIICLNLHDPIDVAEQVAVADTLSDGRMSIGFGSGSTPEEFAIFGKKVTEPAERHENFEKSLRTILALWNDVSEPKLLPTAAPTLASRCWLACNSAGSARIAGTLGFNMMFSHFRTPEQNREYREVYEKAGGDGLVAANRPVYVAADDDCALREIEGPLRTLWRRFQHEGKIPAAAVEPASITECAANPINFLIGGPESVAQQIVELRELVDFDVLNLEPRWAGLSPESVCRSLTYLAREVLPLVNGMCSA